MTMSMKAKAPALRPRIPLKTVPFAISGSPLTQDNSTLVMVGDHIAPELGQKPKNIQFGIWSGDCGNEETLGVEEKGGYNKHILLPRNFEESGGEGNILITKPSSNPGNPGGKPEVEYEDWTRTTPPRKEGQCSTPRPTPRGGIARAKFPIRQKALKIETKTIAGIPGLNTSRDPADWYMYSLQLLRNTTLSKNLFELYCLASRKDHKMGGSLAKFPRTMKKTVFVPDKLLKVEGQHFDPMDVTTVRCSDNVSDRIRKFARTNWKTPGEIAILVGREQNRKKATDYCSASDLEALQGERSPEISDNLKEIWKSTNLVEYPLSANSLASDVSSKFTVPFCRPNPQNLKIPTARSPGIPDIDKPLRIHSEDPELYDSKDTRFTFHLTKQEDPKMKLPKLRLTGAPSKVTPNGHPRQKLNKHFGHRIGALAGSYPGDFKLFNSDGTDNRPTDSAMSADAISTVFHANVPPPTPACSPIRPPPCFFPSPKAETVKRVPSHVVKLPDINDGRSFDSEADSESVEDSSSQTLS